MKQTTQRIIDEVSSLSPMERAEIVERIIDSFDMEPDEDIKKAWADEANRRLASYQRGETKTISEEDAFNRIEKGKKP